MPRKTVEVEAVTTHRYAGRLLRPGTRYQRDVSSAREGALSGILRLRDDLDTDPKNAPGPSRTQEVQAPRKTKAYSDMSRGELLKAAKAKDLEVEGTGANGYVTVEDLMAALEAAE